MSISMAIDRDRVKERAVNRMTPPANTSKEAVALRKAALAFANDVLHHVPAGDAHDAAGARANRNLLHAARMYAFLAAREEKKTALRVAREAAEAVPVVLRIQGTHDEKGASWIERYFLRDKAGRYRERKDIPGNGQYAPGDGEIIAWFRSMRVTHVEVAENWNSDIEAKTYSLVTFSRILHRLSREAES